MSRRPDLGYDPDKGYIYSRVIVLKQVFGLSIEEIKDKEGLTRRTAERTYEDGLRWLVHGGAETAVWKRVRAAMMAESATLPA